MSGLTRDGWKKGERLSDWREVLNAELCKNAIGAKAQSREMIGRDLRSVVMVAPTERSIEIGHARKLS